MALPYEEIKLKRGTGFLINDHIYVLAIKKPNGIRYLKCRDYKTCSARAKIENDSAFLTSENHSHDPPSLPSLTFRSKLLDEAKKPTNSRSSLSQLYLNVRNEVLAQDSSGGDILPTLQTFKSIQPSMSRARSDLLPKAPESRMEIDQAFLLSLKFDNDSNFLFYDSGPNDPERIVIFSLPDVDLCRLANTDTWHVDGTFFVVPGVFYQLLTILCEVYGQFFPMLFCLLPSKSEQIYVRAFTEIVRVLSLRQVTPINLKTIVSDFEQAILNAVKVVFPWAQSRGCLFHFAQCIYRKVQSLGYATDYQNEESQEFRRLVRLLIALAHVPAEWKWEYYAFLYNSSADPRFRNLCDNYFQNTWFVRYPPVLWSFYGQRNRTNNVAEGWHSKINKYFSVPHMSFYRFAVLLLEQVKSVEKDLRMRIVGEAVPRRNPAYERNDARCFNLYHEFATRYKMDYLAGFIHGLPAPRNF